MSVAVIGAKLGPICPSALDDLHRDRSAARLPLLSRVHEDDEPIRDADLLADLERGDAASKMTEAEFRRVRELLIGSKKRNKELTED